MSKQRKPPGESPQIIMRKVCSDAASQKIFALESIRALVAQFRKDQANYSIISHKGMAFDTLESIDQILGTVPV